MPGAGFFLAVKVFDFTCEKRLIFQSQNRFYNCLGNPLSKFLGFVISTQVTELNFFHSSIKYRAGTNTKFDRFV